MNLKVQASKEGKINYEELQESFQGWQAYAKWANTYKLRKKIKNTIDSLK